MSHPFLLAQLTDPHIGADWGGSVTPEAALRAAVDAVLAAPDRPDAVLVTGDLANDGAAEQYAVVREQLQRLGMPSIVLAGNHDDREAMRAAFALPGAHGDPIRVASELGPLRVLGLDTTIPGQPGGSLRESELEWLDRTLQEAPDRPTVVAMHHPPVLTGVPAWDATAIGPEQRRMLGRVLARHPHALALVAGHLHRTLVTTFAARALIAVPSTYMQSKLDWASTDFVLVDEPPAYGLHALLDGELVSHVQPVV